MRIVHFAPLLTMVIVAACSREPTDRQTTTQGTTAEVPNQTLPAEAPPPHATTPAQVAKAEADYVGRWVGVEGMVLDVAAKPGGGVRIENQWDLDHKGSFDGTVTAAGLSFTRNGETVTAQPSDGDATGLKWLAGKRDCLTVKSGEGYCRG